MRTSGWKAGWLLVGAVVLGACGGDGGETQGDRSCPGEGAFGSCPCPDGTRSVRECGADGRWGPCICEGTGGGPSRDGGVARPDGGRGGGLADGGVARSDGGRGSGSADAGVPRRDGGAGACAADGGFEFPDGGSACIAVRDHLRDGGTITWADGGVTRVAGNDTCATARTVRLPADRDAEFVFEGSTRGLGDDAWICSPNRGAPDAIYRIEVTAPTHLLAVVHGRYDTVLELRRCCADDRSTVSCTDDCGRDSVSAVGPVLLQPGTWYLIVDGYAAASSGAYQLGISSFPAR